MRAMIPKIAAASLALATPALCWAAQPLALSNQIFVEKTQVTADGQTKVSLSSPTQVLPGDQLVFVLNYRNPDTRASKNLFVTNPLPPAIIYQQANKGALVSVDGGNNWGPLERLSIVEPGGKRRSARPEDVTHIRWQFDQPIPAGGTGKLTFRGLVR